ncbi:hypothetical protein ACHAW6_004245 [Cyclotella cf. meneghiniana]
MPSPRRTKKITDEILEDFSLPDYPAREMESGRMSSSVTSGRAIDRYVASVLSESDDDSIFSTARKSAVASHQSVCFDDDSSFEPVNPFDGSPDRTYANNSKWKNKIRKHWKPLSVLFFGVAIVLMVSAGVASNKNNEKASLHDDGNKAVGIPPVTFTTAPIESGSISEPSYTPTSEPTSYLEDMVNSSSVPTYMPTSSNNAATTEPPLVDEPKSGRPTDRPTSSPVIMNTTAPTPVTPRPTGKPITLTPKPTTAAPTPKPTSIPTMPLKYYEMLKAAKFVSGKTPFDRTDTAQSLAFHWLYYEGNPSNNLYEFFEQYATAVIFFSLTKIRMSSVPTNLMPQDAGADFTSRREICGWSGVRCAYNNTSEVVHVTEIRLPAKKLSGTIPSEIGFLPYLVKLDLAENDIAGTIPQELYGLQNLRHLYLNDNKLQGTISPRIDELHLAEYIYLGQNNLTGTFPSTVGKNRPNNWRFLSLHSNKLTGTLPTGMLLRNAFMVDFSQNNFYGKLPTDITQENFSKLRLLYFNNNAFTGTIPESLMQLKKLKVLFLNDNFFVGGIPDDMNSGLKLNLLTLRAQNNSLTTKVSSNICDLDVNKGEYELVELSVDCEICDGCSLCRTRCY